MSDFVSNNASFDVCHAHPQRELVSDSSRARELLAPLSDRELGSIKHVKLSNKSYTLDAAKCIAEKLAELSSVESVDVSDVIAGRPEMEALSVLRELSSAFESRASHLTAVDVSDNALGQKGIEALLPLLQSSSLRSLRVCNNGMSAAAAEQLARLVAASRLELLHYYNNMSGDDGAVAVAKLVDGAPGLVDFRFSGTRAGRTGSLAIATSLKPLNKLVKLDLVDNVLGEQGGAAIATFLSHAKPPLKHLDLRDCSLGDEGFAPIATALIEAETIALMVLDVSGNELTAESAKALPVRIVANLETLAIEENELGSAGALELASVIMRTNPNARLTTVIASSNEIGSKAAVAICRVLAAACPNLQTVQLDANCLKSAALEQLSDILAEGVLGSMDENDEDADDDDEHEDLGELAASITKLAVLD